MTAPVHLDADAVIRPFESRDAAIGRFLQRLGARGTLICTSALTLAELLVPPLREKATGLVVHYEAFLRSGEGVPILPVDRAVPWRSADLRARFGGKAPDVIPVASAGLAGRAILLSADKRLRVPPEIRRIDFDDLDRWADLA